MVEEIKDAIKEDKVIFGIKRSLKNATALHKVVLAFDSRKQILQLMKANKIKYEVSEYSKDEISSRLGLDFQCEVFGLKK